MPAATATVCSVAQRSALLASRRAVSGRRPTASAVFQPPPSFSHRTSSSNTATGECLYRRAVLCALLAWLLHASSLLTATASNSAAAAATHARGVEARSELRALCCCRLCMCRTMASTSWGGDGGLPLARLEYSSAPSSAVTSKAPMRGGVRLPTTNTPGRRTDRAALTCANSAYSPQLVQYSMYTQRARGAGAAGAGGRGVEPLIGRHSVQWLLL